MVTRDRQSVVHCSRDHVLGLTSSIHQSVSLQGPNRIRKNRKLESLIDARSRQDSDQPSSSMVNVLAGGIRHFFICFRDSGIRWNYSTNETGYNRQVMEMAPAMGPTHKRDV